MRKQTIFLWFITLNFCVLASVNEEKIPLPKSEVSGDVRIEAYIYQPVRMTRNNSLTVVASDKASPASVTGRDSSTFDLHGYEGSDISVSWSTDTTLKGSADESIKVRNDFTISGREKSIVNGSSFTLPRSDKNSIAKETLLIHSTVDQSEASTEGKYQGNLRINLRYE